MKKINIITFFAIIVIAAPNFFSQAKRVEPTSPDKKTVETRINLMVVDSAGRLVEDLKLEDVKIFENDVEQKLTELRKRKHGANIALVVDNTGSMRSQLTTVAEATAILVVNLDPRDEAMIVRFVSSDKVEIVESWTSDQTKLINGIRNRMLIEGGQSAVIDALYLSAEKLKERNKTDPSERQALVLISDGADRSSFYKEKDLFASLKESGIQVLTIALTGELGSERLFMSKNSPPKERAEEFLQELARSTGGVTYVIDKVTGDALKNAIKGVMYELRSQYTVGYSSTNLKRNSTRKLRVEVIDGPNGEKRQGIVRESYRVGKD